MEKPKYTKSISAGSRVYYVDARKDSKNQSFITITEIIKENGKPERRKHIFIHADNVKKFQEIFADVANFVEHDTQG